MSYDISLDIDTGGPEPATVWDGWNITSNVAPMWRLSGADLADFDGRRAGDCLPTLIDAAIDMATNPDKYTPLNPKNGWGDYEDCLEAMAKLLHALGRHPLATIRVSR